MTAPAKCNLYAWVGVDGVGAGADEVALLRTLGPSGYVPMVATRREQIDQPRIIKQLQREADRDGRPIRLITLSEVDTVRVLRPKRRR